MMINRKILCAAFAAVMMLSGCGDTGSGVSGAPADEETAVNNSVSAESDAEQSAEAVSDEAESASAEEKVFIPSRDNVKMLGRTFLDNDVLWLAQTDSGCEFSFSGSSASFTAVGDSTASGTSGSGSYARYAVYLNGERIIDDLMKEPSKKVEIFSSDEESENVVSVIKLSESANSTFGIRDITVVSSGDISPTPEKDLKIEFIGDSITCGYGVDDEVKENHFSTETEDGTKTYAYKTAMALDADYSMVCYSGHGIVSGYTTLGKKQAAQLVPSFYEKVSHSYIKSASEVPWDFSLFTPDVIVINLGTNDASYCGGNLEYQNEFRDGYIEFLEKIRADNPDAYILCTLGIMGNNLYPSIEEAVIMYKDKTGDEKVSTMLFDNQSMDDGICADWHPSETTHEKAAAKLTEEIQNILNG